MGRIPLRFGICFVLPLLFSIAGVGPSRTSNLKALIARFESRYKEARTLQATFLERYLENGRVARVEAGTVYFRRPGRMRWAYESPERNLFLIDGKTAWFYVPSDRTVTRVAAKQSTDWRTPLALLAGEMKVSRICAQVQFAAHEPPETPEDVMLYCELRGGGAKPQERGSSEFTSAGREAGEAVFFEVARNTGDLVRVLVRNSGGVGIEFQFKDWRDDPRVDDSLFRFTVPPGVAIVNGELAFGENGPNP
jgi:outer membrane lipoprotein carrier protein